MFKIGFSEFESLDLTNNQINDLLNYFLSHDLHLNQSIVYIIKNGKEINDENIISSKWEALMQK